MRPIQIVNTPVDANGNAKQVNNHQDWRQDLIDCYGPHCAYCNTKLPNTIHVEHEVAQSLRLVNPLAWNNLVLACGPCNIAKTNHRFTVSTHFTPTHHNTHLAFEYKIRPHKELANYVACIPVPHSAFAIGSRERRKALRTLKDLKLSRVEQNPSRARRSTDIRWKNRHDAHLETITARNLWDSLNTQQQQTLFLLDLRTRVFNTGFFSLWFNIFHDIPDALRVIVSAFRSTYLPSFPPNLNYAPQIRIPGDL